MKNTIGMLLAFGFCGCSSFSDISRATQISLEEDGYFKISNPKAGIESLTYRDFKFATDSKTFKTLNKNRPGFKNILVYAKTTDTDNPYDFYILYNPEKPIRSDKYIVKDTVIRGVNIVMAVSADASEEDRKFILGRLSQDQ